MSQSVNRQTINYFWRLTYQHKKRFWLSMLIPLQAAVANTAVPFLIGKILASLGHSETYSFHLLFILAVTMLITVVLNYISFSAFLILQPEVMAELEEENLSILLRRGMGFHNNRVSGKLITDATQYVTAYTVLASVLFTVIMPFLAAIITGLIVVTVNAPVLGLIVFLMTVSVIAVALYQTISHTEDRDERHEARREMVAHFADTVTNVSTVKTFAHEDHELRTNHQLSRRLFTLRSRDWLTAAHEGSGRIAVLMAFEIAFIALVIHLVQRNHALLGIGIFTFSYALNLGNRLFDIGTMFRNIEDALLDASDITTIKNQPVEIIDSPNAAMLHATRGKVNFSAVGFHYQDNNKQDPVFTNLSLQIEPGEKVGLVGSSGGGKSTLTKLLLRFEDIQDGTITIDAQDISQVTQASLRQAISYVPQEPLLFHRTVKENIAYGRLGSSDKEIIASAKKAFAHDFIQELPAGYDTMVGERGVKLSGGQRQRIAIARAMLKNAPILVLDEATSALDSESEVLIQDALWKLMEGRTAIVIAHRLSTIQKMDRIIVLSDGKIAEQGTHRQLLKKKAVYAKLWAHQSGGFIED